VLPAACSAWGIPSVARVNHALAQHAVLAVGATPDLEMRSNAFQPAPAMTTTKQLAANPASELLPVNGTRKQNVHKTRINAGGYGAMGPHPEREPA
jgi:hypothetical protein